MKKPSPIIMQTLWRARGTYFWSLFRKNPKIRAYYEPLHQELAKKTHAGWDHDFSSGIVAYLRHPPIERHYFSEYPLRPDGGVALFNPNMSLGNFILTESDEDLALEAYLRSLVSYATEQGQQAFFKFTRGGLRAGFIHRKFGGTHIYLNRPPALICESYRSFGSDSYFTRVLTFLIIRYADHPFCNTALKILREFGVFDDSSVRGRLGDNLMSVSSISAQLNERQVAILVATFWLAYLLEGLVVADIVIDTERLGYDAKYRTNLGTHLAENFGANVLTDYRADPCIDDFMAYARGLREILASDSRLRSRCQAIEPAHFASLGASSHRLLDAVI